jgi:hypothetical protein
MYGNQRTAESLPFKREFRRRFPRLYMANENEGREHHGVSMAEAEQVFSMPGCWCCPMPSTTRPSRTFMLWA